MGGAAASGAAKTVWDAIEAERSKKPPLELEKKEIVILVEAVKAAEEFKPSQHAKREVFRRHGVLGTPRDRLLTAVFYDTLKRQGILDRIAEELTGAESALILDPWLRAALRTTLDILLYHRPTQRLRRLLRPTVSSMLSEKTHPYVGMYYWRLYDRLQEYRPSPRSIEEALMYTYNLPLWFVEKMRSLLGEEEAEKLFQALNQKPMISIRVNTLKASVEEVIAHLEELGLGYEVSSVVPTVIRLRGAYDFERSKFYAEGKIVVQEEAAALASILLSPRPGETVVDMCAAPGGKTIHMAELMKLRGRIYAIDIDSKRIERMKMLLRRTGTRRIVKILRLDAKKAPRILGRGIADKVMLDAPCTSTGTMHKNPELRWRVHPDRLGELVEEQRKLLLAGLELLRPGGRLLYVTCSLLPEENEENIKWLLEEKKGKVELVPLRGPYEESPLLPGTMRAWPHRHRTIGFFYALLEKKE